MAQKNPSELLRAYLIIGTDELKRSTAIKRLCAYIPDEWTDFCLSEFEGEKLTDAEELNNALLMPPFGADFKLVVIHNVDKLIKDVSEALVDYIASPNPQTILCCEGQTLAKNTRLYKAFNSFNPKCILTYEEMKPYQLADYVVKIANSMALSVDQNAAQELVNRCGTSTIALDNQLKTLREMYGDNTHVTLKLIQDNVAYTTEINPWKFADEVCDRNLTKAFQYFELIKDDDMYFSILYILIGRLRELICAKSLIARGKQYQLASELGTVDWKVKNHVRWAQKYTSDELNGLLGAAKECEHALKSSPDSRTAFTEFLLKFAR